MNLLYSLLLLSISIPALARPVFPGELKDELHKATAEGHRSLDYKSARIKMFNILYLEQDEQGFYNKDVYCTTKHYRASATEAAPTIELPDHTVMNTEHTWPQSRFSTEFNDEVQKTDLHHLYPTFSKINAERGNYQFAEVGVETNRKPLSCAVSKLGNPKGYGQGVFFEPHQSHKGNVARALFYFSIRYKLPIAPVEEIFLKYWHMIDPVDPEESRRNELISTIQNNRNPFIDRPELVLQISDF